MTARPSEPANELDALRAINRKLGSVVKILRSMRDDPFNQRFDHDEDDNPTDRQPRRPGVAPDEPGDVVS